MREAARRLPGAHLGVFRAFLERAKPGGRSRGWDDSRGCCLLRLEEKRGSVSVRKLYWFPALRRPGRVLLGSQGRDCRVSFCEEPLFFVGFFSTPSEAVTGVLASPRLFSAGGEGWSPPRWFFLDPPTLPFKMWLLVRLPFNSLQVQ